MNDQQLLSKIALLSPASKEQVIQFIELLLANPSAQPASAAPFSYEVNEPGAGYNATDQLYNLLRFLVQQHPEQVAKLLEKIRRPRVRRAGLAKGLITMSPDFDEPLEDFKDYM